MQLPAIALLSSARLPLSPSPHAPLPFQQTILATMLAAVEAYGHMPNGMRSYYLKRSQPPLLSQVGHLWGHARLAVRQWAAEALAGGPSWCHQAGGGGAGRHDRAYASQSHWLLRTAGWPVKVTKKHTQLQAEVLPR